MRKSCCTKPRPWRRSTASNWSSRRWKRFLLRPWEARPMRNILLIAKREYLEQIRGRAFLFSTVLVPLLIAGMVGWSAMNSGKAGTGQHLAIAADNAALAGQVRREMLYDKAAKLTVDVVAPATPEDRAALRNQLKSKSIDGILAIDSSSAGAITASYTSLSLGDRSEERRCR